VIGDAAERDQSGAGSAQPGAGAEPGAGDDPDAGTGQRKRPTLNASVRRRRSDRAFYIRLAGAIRQNERALERLKQ
jgi:hypothetical protein